MNEEKHTQGPLVHDTRGFPHADVRSVSGRNVANTWGIGKQPRTIEAYERHVEMSRANARRIVACWNACIDLPTELIEQVDAMMPARLNYQTMQRNHDRLLKAVQSLIAANKAEGRPKGGWFSTPATISYQRCQMAAWQEIHEAVLQCTRSE